MGNDSYGFSVDTLLYRYFLPHTQTRVFPGMQTCCGRIEGTEPCLVILIPECNIYLFFYCYFMMHFYSSALFCRLCPCQLLYSSSLGGFMFASVCFSVDCAYIHTKLICAFFKVIPKDRTLPQLFKLTSDIISPS